MFKMSISAAWLNGQSNGQPARVPNQSNWIFFPKIFSQFLPHFNFNFINNCFHSIFNFNPTDRKICHINTDSLIADNNNYQRKKKYSFGFKFHKKMLMRKILLNSDHHSLIQLRIVFLFPNKIMIKLFPIIDVIWFIWMIYPCFTFCWNTKLTVIHFRPRHRYTFQEWVRLLYLHRYWCHTG